MWKGVIALGDERVPVKLYAGAQDRKVHFRLLSSSTLNPVQQRMVSSKTGREVPADKIQKGYATEDGRFVILTEEELAELEPEPSREIHLTHFLPPEAIDSGWYDRPYFLGPDGDAAGYGALVDALESEGKEGIARWVMRKKEYVGALRVEGRNLALVTLRRVGEVLEASELPAPAGRKPEAAEIRMAEQLVGALAGDFDPGEFKDEYRKRVLEFVKAKAKGRAPKPKPFAREPAQDADLAAKLEESLAAMKKKAA
jgi:DNA end-binding protein Ku